ncbi:hypothetical protein C6P45_002458 [Maudiozyma exigua]|uniref:Rad4 beta-hairpin domain-containing protein n=1 Tax=Maudiozyma exigua TaxID=34358 RepID=A0A9P6VVX7_MAUEX|nr:hypothetical protein C6P45_002458 [Kazachstania exigua]
MIPFMMCTFKQRMKWTTNDRLNKRLKRSIPKTLLKKFKKWSLLTNEKEKEDTFPTLLLGLVMWFRDHYQINSNGFRQNNSRLDVMINQIDNETGNFVPSESAKKILENQHLYYGSRPRLTNQIPDTKSESNDDDDDDILHHIRLMAKKKMANRDILCLFFYIILRNVLSDHVKKLSLCFSLPLMNFDKSDIRKKENDNVLEVVPNQFDSDLLQPYFWIELSFDGTSTYVVDPVVHLEKKEIISKFQPNDNVSLFSTSNGYDNTINSKQIFYYVLRMDNGSDKMDDVSPRYIENLCYRYMKLPHDSIIRKSRHYISYQIFKKWLKRFNDSSDTNEFNNLADADVYSKIAFKHISLPKSLHELKKSENFTTVELLHKRQIVGPSDEFPPISMTIKGSSKRKIELIWKNQIVNLKSRQHWLILGRSIKSEETPLKLKMTKKSKGQLLFTDDNYEIKELFSWEQTVPSLKLKNFYIDKYNIKRKITDVDFYKNKFKNVEIYLECNKPDGFQFINLKGSVDIKALIRKYNNSVKRNPEKRIIKYLDVVSGFDFKQKHGCAVPVIENILVNDFDYNILFEMIKYQTEVVGLQLWLTFLNKLQIKDKLDNTYGDV